MRKRLLSTLLALCMALALLPGTAAAAQITLSEQYVYKGTIDKEWAEESYWSSPVVTDLDGDGKLEVINASYTLYVMDAATGAEKWRVSAGRDITTSDQGNVPQGKVFCDFKVLDIDADGSKEIVIGYGDGSVSVLNNQGYFKPGWPQKPVAGAAIRSLAVDDLDRDGKMEIIVGLGHENPVSLWVYRCDGTVAPGWPQLDPSQNGTVRSSREEWPETAYGAGMYANGITTGDLDGDGRPEVIAPTDCAYIGAYRYDGTLVKASDIYSDQYGGRMWGKIALWEDYDEEIAHKNEGFGWNDELNSRATTYRAQLAHAGTAYTDMDGDGISEVVVATMIFDRTTTQNKGNNVATLADSRYMTVFILNQDRSRYVNEALGFDWTSVPNETNSQIGLHIKPDDPYLNGNVSPEPVCSDLDGDGYKEVLFNSYDGKLHCFSLDWRNKAWSFTLPKSVANTVYEYATPPVCKDLDGDGTQEVIFASWLDGSLTTGMNGALYVLDCKGGLLAKMDLHNAYYSGYNNGVMGSPTVEDIDGDGKYEVLLNTTYYGLCAYEIALKASDSSASPTKFTDVSASSPFVDAINWAVEKSITTGKTDTTFAPGEECTNGQILTFLWRANGSPEPTIDNPFTDSIPASFQKAAVWAYEKGLVSGAVFGASAPCTRALTVEYLWKAAGSPAVSESTSFADVPANADYAQAVAWAVENGVTSGTGNGQFSPDATCTRGHIVTFLYRAMKK